MGSPVDMTLLFYCDCRTVIVDQPNKIGKPLRCTRQFGCALGFPS